MKNYLRILQIATLACFAGLILLPSINERFSFFRQAESHENRYKTPRPDFDSLNLDRFVKEYDTYYTDNFNLRENFIKILDQFEYRFLGVSAAPNDVLIGKEGWFFERKSQPNYKGANLFTQQEIDRLRQEIKLRTTWAAQRNIKYYVAIVPNKMNVYPEFLPYRVIKVSDSTRYDQVVALDQSPAINVIDIRKNILKHKNEGKYLYQHTDDHWNELGAFYGYQAIMDRLNKDIPGLGCASLNDFSEQTEDRKGGNMANMINAENDYHEQFITLVRKQPELAHDGVKRGYTVPKGISDWDYEIVKVNENGKTLKCLIIRDSFTFLMVKFLQEHFHETVFIHSEWKYEIHEELIQKEKPDIVLNIVLETEIHKLLQYPFVPGSEKKFSIKAFNGKFVCAEESGNRTVVVDREQAGNWESFLLKPTNNNKYTIQTSDGYFFCADQNNGGKVSADRATAADWETFEMIRLPGNLVAFKASNGKYLSLDPDSKQLFANRDTIGETEKFGLQEVVLP